MQKVARVDNRVVIGVISRKIKNLLLKVENIKKLAKSKKLDFAKNKTKKIFQTDFFTIEAKLAFM